MSKVISLQAGQWYRNREGTICYCVGPLKRVENRFMIETANGLVDEYEANGIICKREEDFDDDDENYWKHLDLVEHLPGCDGFDWEPPKRPDAPDGWRWLEDREPIEKQDNFYNKGALTFPDEPVCNIGNTWEQIFDDYKDIAWGVLRKIEPKYMAFTWDQRDQIRDKWIQFLVDGKLKEMRISWFEEGAVGTYSINGYMAVWLFENARFLDGTPFGVEVTE